MGKTRTDTLRVTNPTLEDLRWLVSETQDQSNDVRVTVQVDKGDRPHDSDVSVISVVVQR